MITFILKICIAVYLIVMIQQVHSMIQYNSNAIVKTIQIPNKDKINDELQHKHPLLIIYPQNQLGYTLSTMNSMTPGYIIQDGETLLSLDKLCNSESMCLFDNEKIIQDYNLTDHCDKLYNLVKSQLSCDNTYKLSLLKGTNQSKLYKNYREHLMIQSIDNSFDLYLFNPKHESDIKGLELKSIKKWGIKLEVAKDTVVYIPTEWSYFYESNEELVLLKIECDSIPTWLFNRIRRK
jgi:hypothetical protein